MFQLRFPGLVSTILAAAASSPIPHLPNFTPIGVMARFCVTDSVAVKRTTGASA